MTYAYRPWFLFVLAVLAFVVSPALAELGRLEPVKIEQTGKVPEGAAQPDTVVLANEPEGGSAGIALEWDLESVPHNLTPLARIQLADVTKLKVSRPGEKSSVGKGAFHAFERRDGRDVLAGSCPVKPASLATLYTIDVTNTVSEALARPAGQRKVRLAVRMTGNPAYYEVYGVPTAADQPKPVLEIAPPTNWTNDWAARVAPITSAPFVYREACMPIAAAADTELELKLLYPAKRIVEVIHNGTGAKLQEGRDWVLRDRKLYLPPGSHAPIQIESEFFKRPPATQPSTAPAKKPPGPVAVQLKEGTYYHERQIEVTYEPARHDWSFPPATSAPDALPRVQKMLAEKKPVRVVLFGDSITYGGNASKFQGCWPYQPQYGELAMWAVQKHFGGPMEVMNHARGGATTSWAKGQAESQVGAFKPDLVVIAYGMNDRSDERRATFRKDMEELIDTIRRGSPDTELILVTSMLNNPKQPAGNGPILSIRDEALQIQRPRLAHVDMTTTHQELCKRKNYLDTSGNGANHPNDYLHRIYAMRLLEVLIPQEGK